jgi:hypothetical protein
MIQTPRKNAAGARKPAAIAYWRHFPAPALGGASLTGGSAEALAPLTLLLVPVRLLGRVFHLLCDPVDVARVREEVLEELEEPLPDRAAER